MIVADPFGSWVTGRHEGQQDAIALNEAQRNAAKGAMDLNTQAQMNPYQLELAKARAGTEALNYKQSQQFDELGLPLQQEQLKTNLLGQKLNQGFADYGDAFPIMQQLAKLYNGAIQPSTPGGTPSVQHPYQYNGGEYTYGVPTPNIGSPRQAQIDSMQQYRVAEEQRKRAEDATKAAALAAKNAGSPYFPNAVEQDGFLDTSSSDPFGFGSSQ